MSSTLANGRRYAVRRSNIHGRGVFALVDIPKGTRLMEYVGERISHKEADRRYAVEHDHSPHTMLFSVDDKTVIDATRWGNSARFINHSCTPNCEAIEEEGRIFIETTRRVPAGASSPTTTISFSKSGIHRPSSARTPASAAHAIAVARCSEANARTSLTRRTESP